MIANNIPDITLERYLLSELPADRMELIGNMIKGDPSLRKRLDEITASNGNILGRYTPESIVPRILVRASVPDLPAGKSQAGRPQWKLFLAPSLAAAAVVSFAILVPLVRTGYDTILDPYINEVTRVKGAGTRIYVYRKNNSSAELLTGTRRVHEKDLLQIAYYSEEDTHGIILSLDGRGTVTLHYPAPPSTNTRIEKNRRILLPSSYELDDAPGFERFILVTSRTPIDVRLAYRAAEKLTGKPGGAKKADLTIDTPCRQTSLVLLKD
jgi:hypothetical protein